MRVRRILFSLWCWITSFVWVALIFGGDGERILLKMQVGGWRAAYLHITFAILVAVVVPLIVLAAGWGMFRFIDRFRAKAN